MTIKAPILPRDSEQSPVQLSIDNCQLTIVNCIPPRRRPHRIVGFLLSHTILHLTLLTLVALFLFPFFWMVMTSLKTDEELATTQIFPSLPQFRDHSPYVRAAIQPARPAHVPTDRWEAALPHLTAIALASFPNIAEPHKTSAASVLTERLISRLPASAWTAADSQLTASAQRLIIPSDITSALDESLASLQLYDLQLRTLDAHVFKLATAPQIASSWGVIQGLASLTPISPDATQLNYTFDSSSARDIILQYDFDLPVDPSSLHKLILSLKPDDSWHRIDATLDMAGQHWIAQRQTHLAQHRAMSIVFQPPTFEDDTLKAKTWVPLRPVGASQTTGRRAQLRLVLKPSSTGRAIFGKVLRNYARAFYAMPFWTYVGNSVLLVALTTLGTLFSSAFVAYGFSRLSWPGRSVAFLILLSTMMLPAQVTMVPAFLIWRSIGWYNTLNPMWVPAFFGSAFFIFLMVQHMKTIPRELEESARLDGLTALQTWYYIILPQVKPALAAIAIMTFMGSWNEFMGPLIYLRDQSRFPLSLGLFGLRIENPADWSILMAANVLMTLPVIVIFFLCQRYFVEGVTMSGLKG